MQANIYVSGNIKREGREGGQFYRIYNTQSGQPLETPRPSKLIFLRGGTSCTKGLLKTQNVATATCTSLENKAESQGVLRDSAGI